MPPNASASFSSYWKARTFTWRRFAIFMGAAVVLGLLTGLLFGTVLRDAPEALSFVSVVLLVLIGVPWVGTQHAAKTLTRDHDHG